MSTSGKITTDGPMDDVAMWPFVNQIEDLLDAVNVNLVWFQDDEDENPKLARRYLNTAHNLLGAAQTIAAALAVKVGVRNELSRSEA